MKKYFRLSLVFLFCFQSSFSKAQNKTVVVKSPYTSLQEFLLFIDSSNSISYAEYLLIQKRKLAKSFKLKEQLLKAQRFYLSGEGEQAEKVFREISNLAYKSDWDKEERRIIIYSLLRIAQTQEDPEQKKALLLLASDFFSSKINTQSYLDYDLFPPPLMEELKEIQKKQNHLSLAWSKIFPDHEIILINGERKEKQNINSLPQTVYRISALSSSHQTWSKNISLSELAGQIIKTAPLTKGSCQNLELAMDAPIKNIKLAPVFNCPNPDILKLNSRIKKAESFKKANLKKSDKTKQQNILSHWPTWLVLGAGTVALSLMISLEGNKQNKKDQANEYVY